MVKTERKHPAYKFLEFVRFLAQHPSKRTCIIRRFLLLSLRFLMGIIVPSLHMGKQELGRHIQWKEEQEKRYVNQFQEHHLKHLYRLITESSFE